MLNNTVHQRVTL